MLRKLRLKGKKRFSYKKRVCQYIYHTENTDFANGAKDISMKNVIKLAKSGK